MLGRLAKACWELGVLNGLRYSVLRVVALRSTGVFRLRSKRAKFPLKCRAGKSDPLVFSQVFVGGEYADLLSRKNVSVVIDCGANVGYVSAYLLSAFPGCRLIAVEPDPDNCELLGANLAPYRTPHDRVRIYQAGLWSHKTVLALEEKSFRDGRSWTRQVREAKEGELPAIDLGSILEENSIDRVSILKMDIEGAECVVFQGNLDWLDKVDALVIELHDDSHFGKGTEIVIPALKSAGFKVERKGQVYYCEPSQKLVPI